MVLDPGGNKLGYFAGVIGKIPGLVKEKGRLNHYGVGIIPVSHHKYRDDIRAGAKVQNCRAGIGGGFTIEKIDKYTAMAFVFISDEHDNLIISQGPEDAAHCFFVRARRNQELIVNGTIVGIELSMNRIAEFSDHGMKPIPCVLHFDAHDGEIPNVAAHSNDPLAFTKRPFKIFTSHDMYRSIEIVFLPIIKRGGQFKKMLGHMYGSSLTYFGFLLSAFLLAEGKVHVFHDAAAMSGEKVRSDSPDNCRRTILDSQREDRGKAKEKG